MKNWFDIATPHEDIRRGDFDEAVFAADLGDVVAGRAPADYNDPYTFYQKTYLTEGLKNLLRKVHRKLTTGKGASVVEVQTPFGGGKTHSLVAVYHYLQNGSKIRNLLPDDLELVEPRIFSLVGTQVDAASGLSSDGVTRQTLWGEIAFQLGGKSAYEYIKSNDLSRNSPGKEKLRELLESLQPFVLLFDELLEYIVKAQAVEVVNSTLAAESRAFLKELTEVVAALPQAMMLVTLPSSDIEDFGESDQRNLAKLEKIFERVESIETPVEGEEVYSIIRRRLFEPNVDEQAVKDIVGSYFDKYREHKDELPPKASEPDFRRKMELAYPFHPDVIDILYEKWSTFPSFQRTRGVLQLLAHVIGDLYDSERNLDLILPGEINLGHQPTRRRFLTHIGQEYEGIIGSDISGVEAKSQSLDQQNKAWKHLAERNATAIFLHSFAADDAEKGTTLPYIKLAVLRSGTIPSMVTEVIQKQSKELWYLNQKSDNYYFSNVPNLNRMILDKMDVVPESKVKDELETRLKSELGSKFRSYMWPHDSSDVPDSKDLKLVVLDPTRAYDEGFMKAWMEKRGPQFRTYKNTVFFAVPESSRFGQLENKVREYLSLKEISRELADDERPGMRSRRKEVKRRLDEIHDDFGHNIRNLYRTVGIPKSGSSGIDVEMVDLGQPTIGKEYLDSWYWKELTDGVRKKIMVNPPGPHFLKTKFLRESDSVSLEVLLDQFFKEPSLLALPTKTVLADGIAGGVRELSLIHI